MQAVFSFFKKQNNIFNIFEKQTLQKAEN